MSIWKTLLGAGIGWWVMGPVGGILGMVIGSLIGTESNEGKVLQSSRASHDGFVASLLVLIAAVMKADGKVLKAELDYAKAQLRGMLGEQGAAQALIMLRDILKKDIPLQDVCHQIRVNVDYSADRKSTRLNSSHT